jgi:DNA mismatch endonuclease (patch repair protein)
VNNTLADHTPPPTDEVTRRRMRATRSKNSRVELALRSELHRRGRRFYLHQALFENKRYKVDIVFPRKKVAVYVDGCFWHSCPQHGSAPKSHGAWWSAKLARNRARDAFANQALSEAGWAVVRVWEHEDVLEAADRVEAVLAART